MYRDKDSDNHLKDEQEFAITCVPPHSQIFENLNDQEVVCTDSKNSDESWRRFLKLFGETHKEQVSHHYNDVDSVDNPQMSQFVNSAIYPVLIKEAPGWLE